MTTWIDLKANIRADLQDTSDTPKWSDELLYLYACDAIRDYSLYFPKREDQKQIAPTNLAYYALPTDALEVVLVELPANRFLSARQSTPGRMYPTLSRPTQYYIDGGKLYLNGPVEAADKILLTYYAVHTLPNSATDATTSLSVPDRDLELLRLYVRAEVHVQMRSKTSRLDRFDQGSGRRDDNPLTPESSSLWEDYYRKLYTRLPGGAVKLYRQGRTR